MEITIKGKKFYPGRPGKEAVIDESGFVVSEPETPIPASLHVQVDIVGSNEKWHTSSDFSLDLPEDATDAEIESEIRKRYN